MKDGGDALVFSLQLNKLGNHRTTVCPISQVGLEMMIFSVILGERRISFKRSTSYNILYKMQSMKIFN